MAKIDFDPNEYEPSNRSFDVLPAGQYNAMITSTDIRDTKDGKGAYVWLEYTVTDGEYENRKMWGNYNVRNENEQAEKIAKQEMSAICAACDIKGKLDDTDQLLNIPLRVGVAIKKDKTGQYADQNQVRSWAAANVTREGNGGAPRQDDRRSPPTPPPAKQVPAKAPPAWAKK